MVSKLLQNTYKHNTRTTRKWD